MKNQTAYLDDIRTINIRDSEMPVVGADDVLVKISHVTICGSDAHFFEDPTFGGMIQNPKLPIVLGHECGGIIEEVGKNVTHLKVGDKVAIEPGAGCGVCSYCLEGHYNLCRKMDFMAAPPFTRWALSRYVSHPAKMVFPLPDNMDTVEGALMEPLCVGMHAIKRSGASLGMKAVVLGTGCIGLMAIASLKAMGVQDIIVVDLYDLRLEFAKKMGATVLINASKENVIEKVLSITDGLGANIVVEAAGNSKTASMTVDLVRPGGKIVMVGNIHGDTPFRFMAANDKEADVISVFRYVNMYPTAIKAVSSGVISVKDMITKTFPFEKTQEAFICASDERDKVMKIAIEF